ncbi:MAG: methyltransferase domain-containing protein [Spirochaetes bacterium]|nr:methyltransferase domain-containing protein [Spirochaetota bacterium]
MKALFYIVKLYNQMAHFWHLVSEPDDYKEEAGIFTTIFHKHSPEVNSILELGSGGGNTAFHLKKHFTMTLVDLSKKMLIQSQKINPQCRHIKGDMRNVRLNQLFDGVLVHDAIMYMKTESDLKKVMDTAFIHCRSEGVALFLPDFFKETFYNVTSHGGTDDNAKGIRYLEWVYDPDPEDNTITVDFAFLIKNKKDQVKCLYDRHIQGLFNKTTWLKLARESGFTASITPIDLNHLPKGKYNAILGVKNGKIQNR